LGTISGRSSSFLRVRAVLALAAAGTVLAACGSSSKGTSTSAPAGTLSTAPSTSSSSPASSKSSDSGKANLGGGSFCDKARTASADVESAASKLTESPDQLKTFEEKAQSELSSLADSAPSDIKGAVSTLAGAENQLLNTLKAANYDFTKIDTSALTAFNTPQVTAAVQQIDTYLVTKCGLSPSDFPTDTPS
jgi:hypothetical protein